MCTNNPFETEIESRIIYMNTVAVKQGEEERFYGYIGVQLITSILTS